MTDSETVHATALVAGETGILITGPSGSGKSRIAMELIQAARADARFAALIGDDRVGLRRVGDRVLATAPRAISGMIELRGSGILKMPHLPCAVMHVAVAANHTAGDMRLPPADDRYCPVPDIKLPLIYLVPGYLSNPLELIDALREDRLLR